MRMIFMNFKFIVKHHHQRIECIKPSNQPTKKWKQYTIDAKQQTDENMEMEQEQRKKNYR
jgi:hypothetical protein